MPARRILARRLDLLLPKSARAGKPLPLVVNIHGGGVPGGRQVDGSARDRRPGGERRLRRGHDQLPAQRRGDLAGADPRLQGGDPMAPGQCGEVRARPRSHRRHRRLGRRAPRRHARYRRRRRGPRGRPRAAQGRQQPGEMRRGPVRAQRPAGDGGLSQPDRSQRARLARVRADRRRDPGAQGRRAGGLADHLCVTATTRRS